MKNVTEINSWFQIGTKTNEMLMDFVTFLVKFICFIISFLSLFLFFFFFIVTISICSFVSVVISLFFPLCLR